MNMVMKIFKRIMLFCLPAAALCMGAVSCNVSEDMSDCVGNFNLTFRFTQGGQNNFGPEIPSLSVFVFDEAGIFLGRWDENDNTKFGADYTMTLPLPPGKYSFVAWGGLADANYYLCCSGQAQANAAGPVIGESHIDDMLVRLTANHSNEITYKPAKQFHGEAMDQTVLAGGDNDVVIDLVKNNKEIRLNILGLPMPTTRANPFTQMTLWFTGANGGYNFHNVLERDCTMFTYNEHDKDGGAGNSLTASFHTLQLKLKDSSQNTSTHKYTLWNSETSSAYHTADLLHDYISKVPAYNTQQKIDAEDLFEITIDLTPYVGVAVTVNGWKVDTSGSIIQ